MFKPGDRVICIDINELGFDNGLLLELGKLYIVEVVYPPSLVNHKIKLNGIFFAYFSKRFILLKEYRKQKLNKICLSQERK